jgi:hypothetical protein
MRRTVYINKIKKGSKFRIVGSVGGKAGGGKTAYTYPTFPTFTISIHPDYANFVPLAPLSPQWLALRQAYLGPSTAAPQDYLDSLERFQDELEQFGQDNQGNIFGTLFTPFAFGDTTHFIGTVDQNGNIIRTP